MILWHGWPASFKFAAIVFLVEWLVICCLTWDGFHYLTDAMFPYSGLGIPNTGGGSWCYSQKQRSRILHGFGSMFYSWKSLAGFFSPQYVHHICWGNLRVLFRKLPCLVLIGFSSNWTQHFCLHLQNGLPRRHCIGLDCIWVCDFLIDLQSRNVFWVVSPLPWYRSSFVFEFRVSCDKRSGRNNGVIVLTRWP